MDAPAEAAERRTPFLARAWPLLLVLAAVVTAYAFGLHRHLSFENLAAVHAPMRGWVSAHPVLAQLAYVAAYAAAVLLTFPGPLLMTLVGGLLFGAALGGGGAILGATLGAVIMFLAARHALADWFASRRGGLVNRIRPGLARDGLSYLVALRIAPVLPFWVTNVAAAAVGMPLRTYVLGTVGGLVPGSFVVAWLGAGLAAVLAREETPDLSDIVRPSVIVPLLALGVLALSPVAWRRWRGSAG